MSAVENAFIEGGEEAREAASPRWHAVQAFNASGLTPAAIRVGIALVCAMDAQSRACFPSELWLATMTGLSERAISKAKRDLQDADLIAVVNGGSRGQPHSSRYGFNFYLLEEIYQRARSLARSAVEERKRKSKAVQEFGFKPEQEFGFKPEQEFGFKLEHAFGFELREPEKINSEQRKPAKIDGKTEQVDDKTAQNGTAKQNAGSDDLSNNYKPITVKPYHDAGALARDAGAARAPSSAPDDMPELPGFLDRRVAIPRPVTQRLNIWEVLKNQSELLTALVETGQEEEATTILHRDGAKAAIAFVSGLVSQEPAA
jgi:hypothetical protein